MELFISPEWLGFRATEGSTLFDAIWNLEGNWVEPPNYRRGGWSGVARMNLPVATGSVLGAYLKRQENHGRLSLRHPFRGEATFTREFEIISHLRRHKVPTLDPIYYGEYSGTGERRAILMTKALEGYRSLEDLMDDGTVAALPFAARRHLLDVLAHTVRQMHDAGVEHRSLHPKHLMVLQRDEGFEVALIDLEKSRRTPLPLMSMIRDLITLNRRADGWNLSARLYFYRAYLAAGTGAAALGREPGTLAHWLGRLIYQKSSHRRNKAKARADAKARARAAAGQ